MKHTLILIGLLFLSTTAFVQKNHEEYIIDDEPCSEDKIEIYEFVGQQAEYPGGMEALYKHLGNSIIYPKEARDNNIQGKVYVRFVIEKDGSVGEVYILNTGKTHSTLEEESLRVIKSLPNWKPAKNNGSVVRSYMTLPINFKFQDNINQAEDTTVYRIVGEEFFDQIKTKDSLAVKGTEASFPGGIGEMYRFLSQNLKYPAVAMDKKITGKVYLEIIIEKDGRIGNIKILNKGKTHSSLEKESVRVTTTMPRWHPAIMDGKLVRSTFRYPINFMIR